MQNSTSYSIVDVNIITFICQNSYKYIKRKKIRSTIILRVCLVKVRMKFSLYKRVSSKLHNLEKTKQSQKLKQNRERTLIVEILKLDSA